MKHTMRLLSINIATLLLLRTFLCFGVSPLLRIAKTMTTVSTLVSFGAFLTLYMSKALSLRSVDGRIVRCPRNSSERFVFDTIRRQSASVGIRMPEVAVYASPTVNAFATGADRNSSLIAVSTELLKRLKPNEIAAVIAHEISHIVHDDTAFLVFLQTIVNLTTTVVSSVARDLPCNLQWLPTNARRARPRRFRASSRALEVLFGLMANAATSGLLRARELYADAGAAEIVGVSDVLSALARMKKCDEEKAEQAWVTVRINKRLRKACEFFLSHPTMDTRMRALQVEERRR